jgi:hypothetical protein
MKNRLIMLFILIAVSASYSQVFNTASTLKQGRASIGVNPAMYARSGDNEVAVFFRGGYGINNHVDIALNLGINYFDETYLGADVEWLIFGNTSAAFSLAGGMHVAEDVGLDGTANLTFKLANTVGLFTGLDMDIVLADETAAPMWFFIGIEAALQRNFNLIFETDLGINEDPPTIVNLGFTYSF